VSVAGSFFPAEWRPAQSQFCRRNHNRNGYATLRTEPPKKYQQVELVEKSFVVTEYQQPQYWCEQCQRYHTAKLPAEVKRSGLFGKNLIAFTAFMKGRCHMSFTTIQDFFAEVVGIKVSTGFLTKQIRKASDALKKTYNDLVSQLREEKHLHIDTARDVGRGIFVLYSLQCFALILLAAAMC
jgi:transposase